MSTEILKNTSCGNRALSVSRGSGQF